MGCFMGCFGLSNKKKSRNSNRKILPPHQRTCSYELLHSSDPSDASTIAEKPEKILISNLRCDEVETEEEEKKGAKKTRKRVRFDLNVQTIEPVVLPSRYENNYCSDDEEDGKVELSKASSLVDLSSSSVYPTNHRYHNCGDSFEEELGYGESDLEDEDYYTDDEDDEDEDEEEEEGGYGDKKDVTALLNPVENITQWKAVKAKPVRVKQLMKENVEVENDDYQAKPMLKEIIVNTSLSTWISSPIVDITNNMEKRSK